MKNFTWILASIAMIILACGPCLALNLQGLAGVEYSAWDSDEDESGGQLFIPVEISGTHTDFSFKLLSAYAYTSYEDPTSTVTTASIDDSVSGFTDTKVELTYEMVEDMPVALLFGFDLNLPTGQTGLDDDLRSFLRDPDLYPISNLGQGFNVNPTATVAKAWGDFQAGFGLGYVWRGEYDYNKNQYKDYDPGDIFNIVVELDYNMTSNWNMRLSGEMAWYGKNEQDGEEISQSGDFSMLRYQVQYMEPKWNAWLGVASIFRTKSEIRVGNAPLDTEDHNSFGDEWNAELGIQYRLNEETALNGVFNYLNIQENDYPESNSLYYNGGRVKYSLKLGMAYTLMPDLTANLNIMGFAMEDDRNWMHPNEERSYNGYSIGIYAVKMF